MDEPGPRQASPAGYLGFYLVFFLVGTETFLVSPLLPVESLRFLLRDRDSKYTASFDAVFAAEEMNVLLSAPQAPRMNAHCERVIGAIRREVLDHVLVTNETHTRRVLAEYQDHYNRHRPHRSRGQLPPDVQEQPCAVQDFEARRLVRTRVLAGVIHEYRYAS
ncbi:integrase core domain-containing protein [Kutzneria sp. CA-103260]|uniref:integrase core domain-containing protein n=1 Tax=Kutzneria sp. CA-103260 TaxID=2802641 RepID=UPI001BAB8E1E|nr:integrase core domain-containing protein [Kutzneria sp. CA-103260]QUQ67078.1 Integrase core domain protein [Kutzneria sp. CA-103260]